MNTDEKKLFLIASQVDSRIQWLENAIIRHVARATVFVAKDGMQALDKLQNFPPHVLLTDLDLPKLSGPKLVEHALSIKAAEHTAVVVVGTLPPESPHMDEVVSGKLHFLTNEKDETQFKECIGKALGFSSQPPQADFRLRVLKAGDVLLREGDKADYVYLVKKGRLVAMRGKDVVLGNIEYGEFVGEMAYISGDVRNATVTALTDCELIQVPIGRFDKVLFSHPAWSKALMLTLSKRVKAANAGKGNE